MSHTNQNGVRPMTLRDLVDLRGSANRWLDRIKEDDTIEPRDRAKLVKALQALRDFARARVENPQPGASQDD